MSRERSLVGREQRTNDFRARETRTMDDGFFFFGGIFRDGFPVPSFPDEFLIDAISFFIL